MPRNDNVRIAPAEGKLGVLIPGMGAVTSTFIAGLEAFRRGLGKPIGSLTQLGTVRLGKRTEGRSPAIRDFVPLTSMEDLVVGCWDIYEDNAYDAAVKAGVLEIADIIVVNKADLPGADRMLRTLAEMVAHRVPTAEGWDAPVLATEAATGKGVAELSAAIERFFTCRKAHPGDTLNRRRRQMRARILALAETRLRRRLNSETDGTIAAAIDAALERKADPHEVALLLTK